MLHLTFCNKNQLLKATMSNISKDKFHIQLSNKLRLLTISKHLMKLESMQTLITQLMYQYHMKSEMNILLTDLTKSQLNIPSKTQYHNLMKYKQLTHNHTTSKSQLINLIMLKDSYQSQSKELSQQMFLTELMLMHHTMLKKSLKLTTQFLMKLELMYLLTELSQFLMKSQLKSQLINHTQFKKKFLLTDQFHTLSEKKSELKSLSQLKKLLMLNILLKFQQKDKLMILNRMKSEFLLKSKFHNLIPSMKKSKSHNLTLLLKEEMSQLKLEFQSQLLNMLMLKTEFQSKSESQFKEKLEFLTITLSKDKLKNHTQFQKESKLISQFQSNKSLIDHTMSPLKFQSQEQFIKMYSLMSKTQLKLSNKLKDKYLLLLSTNKLQLQVDHNSNLYKDPFLKLLLLMPDFKLKSLP